MRGVSGSGKSTLARKLAEGSDAVIYSTDDFFMVDGRYSFDPKRIGEYHAENQKRTKEAMNQGVGCIIIDNTNTQAWEMRPYVEMALEYGYEVEIKQPDPVSFEELMKRQSQRPDKNLSEEIIKKMLNRFEHNLTIEQICPNKK